MSTEPSSARLARLTFEHMARHDPGGVPLVSPEFVAEQGQHVRILDVREPAELEGPLGHIPAVTCVPLANLSIVPKVLPPRTLIVLVSNRSHRAAVAARYLEALGMTHVAAMDGGMNAWKRLGFSAPRDRRSARWELVQLPPGVGRDGRPLVPVEPGCKLTADQIRDHLGDPGAVRWVKLAAFLMHGKRSCVDGRDDTGVIGTPGGDVGELLLALSCAEDVRGRPFTDEEVERALLDQLETFGRFYMHTDTRALNALIGGFREDPRIVGHIDGLSEAQHWRAFLAEPPREVQPHVLEHLLTPEAMGCGHLKLAMTDAGYGVRPGLTRSLLSAFHRARWAGAPELEWVVLGGDHFEGAVAEVVFESELRSFTKVPLISPQVDGVQIFVNHPQVTAFLRRETAAFFAETGVVDIRDEERLVQAIHERGATQQTLTLRQLANGLPIYRVDFRDEVARVSQVGVVS